MPNNKIQFTLEPIVDAKSAVSGAAQLEKIFKNLKVPPELKQTFNNIFANAAKDIKQVEKGLQEGFKTNKDVTNYEQGLKGLVTLAQNLRKEFKNLDQDNLSEIFGTIDTTELNKAEAAVESLTKEIRDELFGSAFNTDPTDKLTKGMQEFQEAITGTNPNVEELSDKLDRLMNAPANKGKERQEILLRWRSALDQIQNPLLSASEKANLLEKAQEDLNNMKTDGLQEALKIYEQMGGALEDLPESFRKILAGESASAEGARDFAQSLEKFKGKVKYFLSIENGVQLLKRAIRSAFETIKELDAAMTETAVVTDFTVGDMWNQLPEYTKRANDLGVTIKDVYEASTLYYQQGLSTNEVMQLTNATLRMARIAGLEAADATDRMTNALRGFNMELNEANADRVADVYSKLAAISASNVDEISTAMTKVASLAHSANMEFETTAAFLSQIIETTRESAETAGTALKTVVARFSEVKELYTKGELLGQDEEGEEIDVNKVSKALRTAGIDMTEYFTGGKGLDDIFMELAEKWDSLDTVQQRYIATMAAGSRQQSRFIALMQDYARTQELVGAAYNASGASAEQYNKTMESLQTKLNQLQNNWDTFLMGITNSDIVKFFVDALSGILEFVNNLNSNFEGLGKTAVELVEIITLAFGAKGLSKVFTDAVLGSVAAKLGIKSTGDEAEKSTTKLGAFGAALKAAFFPWIMLAVAAVAALIAVIAHFSRQTSETEKKLKSTKKAIEETTEKVKEGEKAYNDLAQGIKNVEEQQKKLDESENTGTKEWLESARNLDNYINDLVNKYPELIDYVSIENGHLKLKQGYQTVIADKLREQVEQEEKLAQLERTRRSLENDQKVENVTSIFSGTTVTLGKYQQELSYQASPGEESSYENVFRDKNFKLTDENVEELLKVYYGDPEAIETYGKNIDGALRKIMNIDSSYFTAEESKKQWDNFVASIEERLEDNKSDINEVRSIIQNEEKQREQDIKRDILDLSTRFTDDFGIQAIVGDALEKIYIDAEKLTDEQISRILNIDIKDITDENRNEKMAEAAGKENVRAAESMSKKVEASGYDYEKLLIANNEEREQLIKEWAEMYAYQATGTMDADDSVFKEIYNQMLESYRATIIDTTEGIGLAVSEAKNKIAKIGTFKDVLESIFTEDAANVKLDKDKWSALPDELREYFSEDLINPENYILKGDISSEEFGNKLVEWLNEGVQEGIDNNIEGSRLAQYYLLSITDKLKDVDFKSVEGQSFAKDILDEFGATNIDEILKGQDIYGTIEAYKQLNERGFDTKAIENYAKYLERTQKDLKGNYNAALQVATSQTKLETGYKKIVDTYKDWKEILPKVKEGIILTSEESGVYEQLKTDLAEMLNTTPEVAEDFLETGENIKLVEAAARGEAGSIDALISSYSDYQLEQAQNLLETSENSEFLLEQLDTIKEYITNMPDLEVGASLNDENFIGALNNLLDSGEITMEQLSGYLSGTLEPVETKKKIPYSGMEYNAQGKLEEYWGWNEVPVIEWHYTPGNSNTKKTLENYGSSVNGGSSGGGGSSTDKTSYWENPYDELYNKVEEINEALRTREALERKYQKLIKNENATEAELRKAYADQLKQLDHEIELQKELEAGRKRQIQNAGQQIYTDSEGNRSTFDELGVTKYARYDFDTGRIIIDWEGLEEIAADSNRVEEGEAAEAYISYLEEHVEMFEDVRDTIWEMEDKQDEIRQQLIENKLSLENRVLDALVAKRQKEIDTLSAINDSINDSTSKMIDSLQDSIAQERQQRSNDKTEQDIADKEARLAYLRMDTSGANAGQIKQLEKEIEDARQNYEDSLIDQAIQQLRDDADEAAEQRAQQISIMQSQLDWEQKNGELWEQVQGLIMGAWLRGENGALNVNSDLFALLKDSEAFNSLSELGKKNWIDEISKAIRSAVGDENAGKDNNSDNNNNNNNNNNNSTGGVAHNPNPGPEEIKTPTYTNYKVKSGDTLTSIAKKFGLSSWQPIYEANKDIIQNPNDIYTWMTLKIPQYKTGGLADFTGPAWLDGTKSSPELVLNADDTKNFISLKNILASLFNNNPFGTQGATAGDAYFDIDINVDELANDYDVDQLVDRVKQQIYDNSMYRNVNTLNFMR